MKIALLPGGFKPPHLGHYNMAKYLADFADKVIVRIGQKERDGIGKELALEIWSFYKEFDPDPRSEKLIISVAQSPSPVKDVYDFVEKIAPEGSTIILGLGEKDSSDGRYNSIPKFAEPRNIKADTELVPPQAGGISGTRMREIIKANDKVEFFKYIPDYLPKEIKEEIWTKLTDTTMPSEVDEMAGGTMNKQEMAKHMVNMQKLRKFLSKQGDQMYQVPTNLTKGLRRKLYEGINYDEATLKIQRLIFIEFKEQLGIPFDNDKWSEYWLEGPEYIVFFDIGVKFTPKEGMLIPYSISADAGEDDIQIEIEYNPEAFQGKNPQFNGLNAEIKETVRHELEHVAQYNFPNKESFEKYKGKIPFYKYLTLNHETPAFVKGLNKRAKFKKIPLNDAFEEFFEDFIDQFKSQEEINIVRQTWTDYANQNLPGIKLNENFPPYKANQVQQTRYKASDTFTNDRKKAKKLGYLEEAGIDKAELMKGIEVEKEHTNDPRIALKIALDHLAEDPKYYTKLATLGLEEMKLFSKEWWSEIIMEELLNEGGAAGHMAHPFDLPNVNTGRDLIKSFEQAADSLKKEPGAVKIDGVNASIRLINNGGRREFAMDRGSKKALDLKGVTKADLENRFGAGHGMIKAGGDVIDIFNNALPTIEEELTALGLWDDPNIMFNMEYVSGKSNVQDYGKNFLAIHGLLSVESKEVQGARKMLVKRVTSEKNFAESDMNELLKKLEPFAKKKGFEIYGSVPTTFTKDPDFKKALGQQYKIEFAEGAKTKSLAQWLNDVTDIPADARIKMNLETGGTKDVGALSKQVYFAVFGGETIDDLFDNEQDIQKAIQGATTYLATEKLGDEILDVLDSPMGSVNDHEGVVIRDDKISPKPFKITGKFITGGVSSDFQKK